VILIDPEVNIDLLTTIFGEIYQKIPSTKLSPLKKNKSCSSRITRNQQKRKEFFEKILRKPPTFFYNYYDLKYYNKQRTKAIPRRPCARLAQP
jgi:hypothetical protein